MNNLILVVEDDKDISEIIKFNLENEGYKVVTAYDGDSAIDIALNQDISLILLDVMIPKKDGFEVCRIVRSSSNVPIIMLTAKSEEVDKVLGLELGADDYIIKPYGRRELLARIKANLRRASSDLEKNDFTNVIQINDLKIDLDKIAVSINDKDVELSTREYELLKFLAISKEQVFSRETLLKEVWDYDYFGYSRIVDVTIRRLREKIEDDPSSPKYIMTKRGVGYYLKK